MKTRDDALAALKSASMDEARHMFYGDRTFAELAMARQCLKYDPKMDADITAISICGHIANAYRLNGK
jgi:hypothetical protein